jgi:D-alanyl-D-alanine carboxypeptidase
MVAKGIVGIAIVMVCAFGVTGSSTTSLKSIDSVELQNVVDTTAKELMVPGVMVLLRTPQDEFIISYGATMLGVTIPPRTNTHFRIASNTKTMTAAVIVQLAQQGKMGLDDPVSKYIFGVPNGDNITISELLRMRSGLYNYTDTPELSASLDRNPTKVWTTAEVLALAFKHPPLFPPGRGFPVFQHQLRATRTYCRED